MEDSYASICDLDGNRYYQRNLEALSNEDFDKLFPLVSCVILTANKLECDSLNYILERKSKATVYRRSFPIKIFGDKSSEVSEAYLLIWKPYFILHLRSNETGSNTPGGSADLVRYISRNQFLNPRLIISFGICYGRDPDNQSIGEVIVPFKLYPWSIGQKVSESKLTIKTDRFNLDLDKEFSESNIYTILKDFFNGTDGYTIGDSIVLNSENLNSPLSQFNVKTVMGIISTGEAVISSKLLKKQISNATSQGKELGGEMEGYGLAKECIYYAHVPCFILKAICDWGEDKNIDEQLDYPEGHLKDKLQAYAAFCAGIALHKLLSTYKQELSKQSLILQLDNIINQVNYETKGLICEHIKQFYLTTVDRANEIFELLLKNDIITKVPRADSYRIS